MPKALYKDIVIAQCDRCQSVEGNFYFPPESVDRRYLYASDTHTVCPWKGVASYYDVEVGGERIKDAAWFYPDPKPAADHIKGYVAFWRGVRVEP